MRNPDLSIIVIVYDMPRQAMNTLLSLALPYQKNVSVDDCVLALGVSTKSNFCWVGFCL